MLSKLEDKLRNSLDTISTTGIASSSLELEPLLATSGVMDGLADPISQTSFSRASSVSVARIVPDPGNTLNRAYNLGTLSGTRTIRDRVGRLDSSDYYRFRLSRTSNFNLSLTGLSSNTDADVRLIRDANNNGIVDSGEVIARSTRGSNSDESINRENLGAGNYFVQVYQYRGNTAYKLNLSTNDPSNLLPKETNIGTLSGTRTFSNRVDSTDTADVYRFSLGSTSNFNLFLTGLSSNTDADVRLIRDANNNGIVDSGEVIARSTRGSNSDESINRENLGAGNYFVQVYQYRGNTAYKLSLSTNDPSNLLPKETNIGTLSGTRSFSNWVGSTDTADVYRFSLGSTSNFNLSLTGLSSNTDADVRLIRDANNNGIVDSGEVIARSTRGSNYDESINRENLGAGNYFVQVYQYRGNTAYKLSLSTNDPSNLLPKETNIGTLSGTRTFSNRVGSTDTADVYRFSLSRTRNVNLTLTGLSSDADVRLIRDANNNGIIDSGEQITRSAVGGVGSEWISRSLGAGSYFVQVYQYRGNTNYNLSVSTGDWYSQNLHDPGIIGLARQFANDGQLSRNDMIAILRDTKDYGTVDATELTDLRTLVSGRRSLMPDYVHNLSDKIVNGNRANQWWTGGGSTHQSLGNLSAGASADHMEKLVGKWFLGTDRPTANANSTYQFTSGRLFQNGISYNDIDQGSLGDCYYMATLAGTAFRTPSTIQSMFIDNGDNTYTVRFYKNGVADYVTVDRYLPTRSSGSRVYAGWGGGSYNESDNELWVALAEKAYAQINESGWIGHDNTNSYAGIDGGTLSSISHVTGQNTTGYLRPLNINEAIRALNNNRITYLSDGGHAYTIVGYNSSTKMFTVYNPWGQQYTRQYTHTQMSNKFVRWGYSGSRIS